MTDRVSSVAGRADVVVVGAGIAGASAAYHLSRVCRVVLLEAEDQPGYHTTGRSAALFAESYGTAQVRALTRASRAFLEAPPPGFSGQPLLSPRGALFAGHGGQVADLDALHATLAPHGPAIARLGAADARALVPVLSPEWVAGGVLDPAAADMDVNAIHQGFLRGLRSAGGTLVCRAPVTALRRAAGCWRVEAGGHTWEAPVVVNAAGAWCDAVASLAGVAPLGLQACRRTAFTFAPPPGVDVSPWPVLIGVDESFYFKPEAGRLLGSPANADPVPPHDVQPEAEDVATAIWRIEAATALRIPRPGRAWAGLRTFAPDGDLVAGFDPAADGFFWCAGQGGYGIQTCPAMGEACAALVQGLPLPTHLRQAGLDAAMLSPARLRP